MSEQIILSLKMKKYFESNKSELAEFINTKFRERNFNHFDVFFDDFLFSYGIISFNCIPTQIRNKYIPYLNCNENNIFREKKGITDLSANPQTLTQCQKIFTEYFISKFNTIDLKTLIEWETF